VTVSVSDSDNCDPSPVCKILTVTSNEPDSGCGSGDVPNDIQITGDLTVKLRAERCGTGKTGRIYTITVQCKDASENTSTKTTTVKVNK
jgi:ferritin-like protein